LLGALVPESHGGNGMGLLPLALAMEEMGAQGYASALLVVTAMDTACLVKNASLELKQRILPKVAQGSLKLCFALTEANAGSNSFRLRTFARRDGGRYLVTGEKTFITGADVADRMLLVVRTTSLADCQAKGLPKAFGLSLLLVDPKGPGVSMTPLPTRGIEGFRQWTVAFDEAPVDASDLVGEENQGALALFTSLNPERILAAALACGIGRFVIEKAVDYAKQRVVFGERPIGSYQGIAHPLAECHIGLEAARLLTHKSAWSFDHDLDPALVGQAANYAKLEAARVAMKAVDRAIQTHGGAGFSEDVGIIYFWEAMRLLKTAPISEEMILNYVAEHDLGLPRSY
ncbi:MAG: acyl-CoA dehydrogenase family protein, partial [Deltaproteobacteria bacterium]